MDLFNDFTIEGGAGRLEDGGDRSWVVSQKFDSQGIHFRLRHFVGIAIAEHTGRELLGEFLVLDGT